MRVEPTRSPLVTLSRSSSVKVVPVDPLRVCLAAGTRRLPTAVVAEAEAVTAVATVLNGMAPAVDDRLCDCRTAPKSSPLQVAVVAGITLQAAQAVEPLGSRQAEAAELKVLVAVAAAALMVSRARRVASTWVETVAMKAAVVVVVVTAEVGVATTPAVVAVRVACRCSRQVQRRPAVVEILA